MKVTPTFLIFLFALGLLSAGCSTPKKLDHPEPDPLSQQDQMNWKVSRLTKSPYTRSGL